MTVTEARVRQQSHKRPASSKWLYFDVHGIATMALAADAPTADLISSMFAAFRADELDVARVDIVITGDIDDRGNLSLVEQELAYSETTVRMPHAGVQLVRDTGGVWHVQGAGELLTSVLPVIDLVAVEHGYAMIHAATMKIGGVGVAMPAAGGTGKTSTIAKAMRAPDAAFMGDDWAFVSESGELLGYAKPMFIKPHHRAIYPHLFQGARKPLVPSSLSAPVGRLTTVVHPVFARHPRLAAFSRRWSPEHRMVAPEDALPGTQIADRAPLRLAVFVERWQGSDICVVEQTSPWLAARLLGNWHIEMARHSRDVLTALGASGVVPLDQIFARKAAILRSAVQNAQISLMQVPVAMSADVASDEIVARLRADVAGLPPASDG
jgi:hypothetical protein